MSINSVIVSGNSGRDPEVKKPTSGHVRQRSQEEPADHEWE